MADALVYVDKVIGCDEIIELSTLTGACMVSPDRIFIGFLSNLVTSMKS